VFWSFFNHINNFSWESKAQNQV